MGCHSRACSPLAYVLLVVRLAVAAPVTTSHSYLLLHYAECAGGPATPAAAAEVFDLTKVVPTNLLKSELWLAVGCLLGCILSLRCVTVLPSRSCGRMQGVVCRAGVLDPPPGACVAGVAGSLCWLYGWFRGVVVVGPAQLLTTITCCCGVFLQLAKTPC